MMFSVRRHPFKRRNRKHVNHHSLSAVAKKADKQILHLQILLEIGITCKWTKGKPLEERISSQDPRRDQTDLTIFEPAAQDGVADNVDAAAHIEFAHCVRLMSLDGLY